MMMIGICFVVKTKIFKTKTFSFVLLEPPPLLLIVILVFVMPVLSLAGEIVSQDFVALNRSLFGKKTSFRV